MHPSVGLGILAVIVSVFAALAWAFLRRKANKIAGVRCQPSSEIAAQGMAAADEKGLVSTEGSIVPGRYLKAPMSGKDCLYWEVEVLRKWEKETINAEGKTEKKSGTDSVMTQKQGSLQEITDGSVPVYVDFTDRPDTDLHDSHSSEVKLGLMVPGELKFGSMRVQTPILPSGDVTKGFIGREKIVPPLHGDTVYVLGKLQMKLVEENLKKLTISKPGWSSLIVSTEGREATLGKTEKHAGIASYVSAGFAGVAAVCAVVGLIVGRPAAAASADDDESAEVQTSASDTAAAAEGETPEAAAADPAASASASPCEEAYDGLVQIVQAMQQKMGAGKSDLPDRPAFLRGCHELPPAVQHCLVMSYAVEHLDECQKAQQSLDPATAARVKKLMGR